MREVILAYLRKKKALVAIKPWEDRFQKTPKSEKIFHEKNQQTYDEDTMDSVSHYAMDGYVDINEHLRGRPQQDKESRNSNEEHIQHIDRGMSKSPLEDDTILWRGFRVDSLNHPILKRLKDLGAITTLEEHRVYLFKPDKILNLKGFTYIDPTYLSTSLNRVSAETFGLHSSAPSSVTLRIHAPMGTQAIYLPASHRVKKHYDKSVERIDFNPDIAPPESEVLLDRGLKYKVTNVGTLDRNHRHLLISVEIVK